MTAVVVAAREPNGGATTIAVGLAWRAADAGHAVTLVRLGADDRATVDAETFAAVDFARSGGAPVEAAAATVSPDGVTIFEAPPGEDAAALATTLGAKLLVVAGNADDQPQAELVLQNHARRAAALAVPEDRTLAAPTVGALIAAANAQILARSQEGDRALCEHIVIGAVASDSDEEYFGRFANKAVVTRAEKVDIALAALRTETVCLILTGGADPSPYLLDRVASGRDTTLVLAPDGTVETVRDIEDTFGRSPFSGKRKIERIAALMPTVLDDASLTSLLGAADN